jgi:hypothetical protein
MPQMGNPMGDIKGKKGRETRAWRQAAEASCVRGCL